MDSLLQDSQCAKLLLGVLSQEAVNAHGQALVESVQAPTSMDGDGTTRLPSCLPTLQSLDFCQHQAMAGQGVACRQR